MAALTSRPAKTRDGIGGREGSEEAEGGASWTQQRTQASHDELHAHTASGASPGHEECRARTGAAHCGAAPAGAGHKNAGAGAARCGAAPASAGQEEGKRGDNGGAGSGAARARSRGEPAQERGREAVAEEHEGGGGPRGSAARGRIMTGVGGGDRAGENARGGWGLALCSKGRTSTPAARPAGPSAKKAGVGGRKTPGGSGGGAVRQQTPPAYTGLREPFSVGATAP